MLANQMQDGVQTWYTLNSACRFKFYAYHNCQIFNFYKDACISKLNHEILFLFVFDNFFGWKNLVFVEKVLLISYLMQV